MSVTDAKEPFTLKYACDRCKAEGLKLWRGVHGAANRKGEELLCAACLAPNVTVGDDGKADSKYGRTDQIGGWLPATFWGYTSVPDADVRWWKALPTYAVTGPIDAEVAYATRARSLIAGAAFMVEAAESKVAALGFDDAALILRDARDRVRQALATVEPTRKGDES